MTGAALSTAGIAVRDAAEGDFDAIAEIYARYVRCGTASFEIEPPGADTLIERWRGVLAAGLPYLIAETGGSVAGFAYATLYRPRRAYRFTVEHSIYVRQGNVRRGVGAR